MHGTKTATKLDEQSARKGIHKYEIWMMDDGILFKFGIVYDANSIDNIIAHRSVDSLGTLIKSLFMKANEKN